MNEHQARASTAGNVNLQHSAVTTVHSMAKLAAAPKPWSRKRMKHGKVGCLGVVEKDLDEATFEQLMSLEDPDPWTPWSELRVELHRSVALPPARLANARPLDAEWRKSLSGREDAAFRNEDVAIAVALVNHPGLPVERLAAYATDINLTVRRAVARNPRTPADVRASLTL